MPENWRLVKVATTKAQRKLFFNLRSMKQGLGTMSQDQVGEIARELNVKRKDVSEMETRLSGGDIALEGALMTVRKNSRQSRTLRCRRGADAVLQVANTTCCRAEACVKLRSARSAQPPDRRGALVE